MLLIGMFLLYKIHLLIKPMLLSQRAVFILKSIQHIDFIKKKKKEYIWVWPFSILVLKVLEALTSVLISVLTVTMAAQSFC